MKIKEIRLENIRSFKGSLFLAVHPQTNLIAGKNGSGKSNILAAIKYMLSSKKSVLDERLNMIYEGNHHSELSGKIEIIFEDFTIKKVISTKKEECFIDDKSVTKEELCAVLESRGIPINSNYFIVPQGEVERLSVISDKERFELIKEISGVSAYEKDRSKFILQLSETEEIKSKIEEMNSKIDQKIEILKKEQRKLLVVEKLDQEKAFIQKIMYERELRKIEDELSQLINEDNFKNEKQAELQNVRMLISKTKREITNLMQENSFSEKDLINENENFTNFQEVLKSKNELKIFLEKEEKTKNNISAELNENKINLFAREMELVFLKSQLNIPPIYSSEEIDLCKEEVEKLKEIANFKTQFFDARKYQNLILERKKLWQTEKILDLKVKRAEDLMKELENQLNSKNGLNELSKEIREMDGVLGCLYELIDIPEEYFRAVNALLSQNYFSLVVENDSIATELIKFLKRRTTYIPLNRISVENKKVIKESNLIPIWEKIEAPENLKDLIRYLCKDTYLVTDVNYAIQLKNKYNINLVTSSGDLFYKSGMISGGYEEIKNLFSDYKNQKNILEDLKNQKNNLIKDLENTNQLILEMQKIKNNSSEESELSKSKLIFQSRKLLYMINKTPIDEKLIGKISKEINVLKETINRLEITIFKYENTISELEKQLEDFNKQSEHCEKELEIKNIKIGILKKQSQIKELRKKENELLKYQTDPFRNFFSTDQENNSISYNLENRNLQINANEDFKMQRLFKNKENHSFNTENTFINQTTLLDETVLENDFESKLANNKLKKAVLFEKKHNLLSKINSLNAPLLQTKKYENLSYDLLLSEIKQINDKKSSHKAINYKATTQLKELETQQNNLKTRTDELLHTRIEIDTLISELDIKKSNIVETTYETIKKSFIFYLKRLSNYEFDFLRREDRICLTDKGEIISVQSLSSGQKTVIALSLIFSIQKIDPASFYIFDEIDASLDEQTRIRLADLINQQRGVQYFFTTFKKELVTCADKCFFVVFEERNSKVEVVDKEVVAGFVE